MTSEPSNRVTPDMLPDRKRPAHTPNVERFNQPIIIFLTVCTKNRQPFLANDRAHEALKLAWSRAGQYRTGHYVIMPDHLHLFCSPVSRQSEMVMKWAAYWKRMVSIQLPDIKPLWQRDGWDTQLRHISHYSEKWNYVRNNPVRKGLVKNADDWPYQGCLTELRW